MSPATLSAAVLPAFLALATPALAFGGGGTFADGTTLAFRDIQLATDDIEGGAREGSRGRRDDVIRTQVAPEGAGFDPEAVHGWVRAYFEATRSMDSARWASAFSPDAVVDDPVGFPVKTTPEEILEMGQAFVAAFTKVGLHESFVHVVGNEAVAKWQGLGTTRDGTEVVFEGINHFTFNADGQITELRGFFAPPGS